MAIDLEIQRLMRTDQVKEINFTMGSARVSGLGFWELSNCFSVGPQRHRIRVATRPQLIRRTSVAQYLSGSDRILVRSDSVLSTLEGRATVVHECTHAQLDLRSIDTRVRTDEAAAFLSEAWYILASTSDPARDAPNFQTEILEIAREIRRRALAARGAPATVTAAEVRFLRQVMHEDYGYRSGFYHNDGIGGLRYNGH